MIITIRPIDMQVEFQLNGQKFTILQGRYTVDTILSRVNQTIDGYNLFIEQGEDERMFMFPFDGLVEIKGNEIFHTQVKNGSSI